MQMQRSKWIPYIACVWSDSSVNIIKILYLNICVRAYFVRYQKWLLNEIVETEENNIYMYYECENVDRYFFDVLK